MFVEAFDDGINWPFVRGTTDHRDFPLQKALTRSFDVLFEPRLNKRWANNRDVGDLRRHYSTPLNTITVSFFQSEV